MLVICITFVYKPNKPLNNTDGFQNVLNREPMKITATNMYWLLLSLDMVLKALNALTH